MVETLERPREEVAMVISTGEILDLLRAKPGKFVEDIEGDELPLKEGDESDVVFSDNGREYRVTARIKQMRDLERQGYVVTQPGRWLLKGA
jgi:hypothetical protein